MYSPSFTDFILVAATTIMVFSVLIYMSSSKKHDKINLLSITLILLFVQYALNAWIAFAAGEWNAYLLSGQHVSKALQFSGAFMFFMAIGYLTGKKSRTAYPGRGPSPEMTSLRRDPRKIRKISGILLLFGLLLAVIGVGGLGEFFASNYLRGHGQFDSVGGAEVVRRISKSLAILLFFGAAAVFVLGNTREDRKPRPATLVAIFLVGVVACIPLQWSYSRVSGAGLIITAMMLLLFAAGTKRTYITSMAMVALALYFSAIGITHRGGQYPGIYNYYGDVVSPQKQLLKDFFYTDAITLAPNANFLDALGPFTMRISVEQHSTMDPISSIIQFVKIMQPLPSSFVGGQNAVRVGQSLSMHLGTSGSTGITTPALAELYALFSWSGIIVAFLLGRVLRWADRRFRSKRTILTILAFAMMIAAFGIGGHSGLRAFARPFGIAVFLFFISRYKFVFRQRTRPDFR